MYRLQLNGGFRFAKAMELVPYLKRLGITEYYCLSFLAARRRRLPDVFVGGDYIPLVSEGSAAHHVVAFARAAGNKRVVAVAPCLVDGLCGSGATLPTGPAVWHDTRVPLPNDWEGGGYRNIFIREVLRVPAAGERGGLRVADIFSVLPAALLENNVEDLQ